MSGTSVAECWVSKIISFSSQYNTTTYAADQVIGKPTVYPKHGDLPGSWASDYNHPQYIEVEFPMELYLHKISVYETLNPGAITKISAWNPNGNSYVSIYTGTPTHDITNSRIFEPSFEPTSFKCNRLRVDIDCSAAKTWCEIDAIKISGKPPIIQQLECWVSKVISFSSQYNTTTYAADQVIGKPTVYPKHGDLPGSWASEKYDQPQNIEVEFPMEMYLNKISVYETYNPGAITGIGAWDPNTNSYISLYTSTPTHETTNSRIFEPSFKSTSFKCNRLRVDIDCSAAKTWCEIDAIQISGTQYNLPPPPPNSLILDMGSLVNKDLFSDVTFIVEPQNDWIFAHKNILVARSDYFKDRFLSNSTGSADYVVGQNEVYVGPNIKKDTVLVMLEFIYTGQLKCDPAMAVDLIKLADMYSLDDLKLNCIAQIIPDHLSVNTVLSLLNTDFKGKSFPIIRELCFDFIAQNFTEVTKSDQFYLLPKDLMQEILRATAPKL